MALAAFAQVSLARDGSLPTRMFGYGAGLTVILLIAHLLVARFAPYADPLLILLAVFLNGLGLAMIYRLDLSRSKACLEAKAAGKAAGKHCLPIKYIATERPDHAVPDTGRAGAAGELDTDRYPRPDQRHGAKAGAATDPG